MLQAGEELRVDVGVRLWKIRGKGERALRKLFTFQRFDIMISVVYSH